MAMDVVGYEIKGEELQFVEIELDPGEAAVREAGSMMFMEAGISMDTVLGDGSGGAGGGLLGKLLGAGKRLVTGESLFTTVYMNGAAQKRKVAFVHAGGTILKRELQAGETLLVDTGCLVALTPTVNFEIQYVGKIKTALFGGEGLYFAKVTGPGTVWLQSLPFSRLASRVFAAAPQRGGSREEGSLLGGFAAGGLLGSVLGGDDADA